MAARTGGLPMGCALRMGVDAVFCGCGVCGPQRGLHPYPHLLPASPQDLTYTVASNTKKGETLALLKNITAYFLHSEMSALMGPSGSGKTVRRMGGKCCLWLVVDLPPPPPPPRHHHVPRLAAPPAPPPQTLLDLLAGRKTVGKQDGDILFAGLKPSKPFLRRYTGYGAHWACACVCGRGGLAGVHSFTNELPRLRGD